AASTPHQPDASSTAVFDMDRAQVRLGGDRRLLREMITIFRTESLELMAAIRQSAGAGDLAGLGRAVHTLKGALGTLGARRALEPARTLEARARKSQLSSMGQALTGLEREMTDLTRALLPPRRERIVKRKGASHAGTRHEARQRARRRR